MNKYIEYCITRQNRHYSAQAGPTKFRMHLWKSVKLP